MKNAFFKVFPFLSGGLLGWLLVTSPPWFAGLGPGRYLVAGALVVALLVGVVAIQIEGALPRDLPMEPFGGTEPRDLTAIVSAYEAAGFERAGPTLHIGMSPAAVLVPLVHAEAHAYGSVFRTGTVPPRTSFDIFSVLADGRARVTSSPDPAAGTLPLPPAALRQVVPGAAPQPLLEAHRAALAFLAGRGLAARRVSPASFVPDYKDATAMLREAFHRAPLSMAATALFRVAVKRAPNVGPLERQPDVERRLAALSRAVGEGARQRPT